MLPKSYAFLQLSYFEAFKIKISYRMKKEILFPHPEFWCCGMNWDEWKTLCQKLGCYVNLI